MIWGCFSWSGLGTASQQSSWMYWMTRLSHQWIFFFPDGLGIFQDNNSKIHLALVVKEWSMWNINNSVSKARPAQHFVFKQRGTEQRAIVHVGLTTASPWFIDKNAQVHVLHWEGCSLSLCWKVKCCVVLTSEQADLCTENTATGESITVNIQNRHTQKNIPKLQSRVGFSVR